MLQRRLVSNLVRLTIAFSVLGIIALRIDFGEFWGILTTAKIRYLWVAFGIHAGLVLLQTLRLYLFLKSDNAHFLRVLKVSLIGSFFGTLLPAHVAGDAYKIVAVRGFGNSWGHSAGLIVLDRLVAMVATIVIAVFVLVVIDPDLQVDSSLLATLSLSDNQFWLFLVGLGVVSLLVLGGAVWSVRQGAVRQFVRDLGSAWASISILVYLLGFGISVIIFIVRMSRFLVLGWMVDINLSALSLAFLSGGLALAAFIPGAFGGLGIQEGTISLILSWFEVSLAAAVSIAIFNRILIWGLALLGGGLYFWQRPE